MSCSSKACLDLEVNGFSGFLHIKKFTFRIVRIMCRKDGAWSKVGKHWPKRTYEFMNAFTRTCISIQWLVKMNERSFRMFITLFMLSTRVN